jgi:hypothetical protein
MTVMERQPYSVRGFLAGVVRKNLGLNLVSEQTDKAGSTPSRMERLRRPPLSE